MNKKLLFGLCTAVSMLFATSCSQEEPAANLGNEGTVTFKVKRNAAAAYADGVGADHLVWEVYDAEGVKLQALSGQKDAFTDGELTTTVDFKLAKGQTYSFAFFAYNTASGDAYNVDSLQNITVDYKGIKSGDETRDAFFGNLVNYTVSEDNFEKEVVLRRPFAQLNFVVDTVDFAAAVAAGLIVHQSQVVVSEVATAFNALNGEVVGEAATDVLFDLNTLPVEDLKIGGVAYKYLSMNYLLPNAKTTGYESTNATATFTFKTNGADIEIVAENAPFQRNYRTNIIGSLTYSGKFNIIIDPIFQGEHNTEGDGFATYGVKGATGTLYRTLDEAINAKETEIELGVGEYTLSVGITTATLNITGVSTDAVVKLAQSIGINGANCTFNNITFVGKGQNYFGLQHAGDMTYNNCVIENQIFCYSETGHKSVFNNCTFEQESADLYNIWTYASAVDFNNCVFNSAGKAALVYAEAGTWIPVNFNDCQFYASTPVDGKAAIEIDSHLCSYIVNIKGCTAEGFALGSKSGNSLYNLKNGELGVNCELNVVVAEGVEIAGNGYALTSAEGLFWFANQVNVEKNNFAGKTIVLANNIDLAHAAWTPVGQTGATEFKGVFDGQGYTISNLNIKNTDESANCATGLFGWIESHDDEGVTVKNVTIDGATISGHHNVAAIAGYIYGTIENCHVKNAAISCVSVNDDANGDKCGAIAGYVGEDAAITGCTAADSKIDAGRDAGQIVGAAKEACVTNCSATNVTVVANGSSTGNNINAAVIGRKL